MLHPESQKSAFEISDFDLMARTRTGNLAAFETLIHRHQQPLLNFFLRMGVYIDAEDLVQETFLRLYRYRMKYEPKAKFTTFLYTLARHAWVDSLRKAKKQEDILERTAVESPASDDKAMKQAGARLDVETALESLSDKLRPVVVLSLCQGLRYEEIAEILEIPVGTVKSRMSLALARLKEIFDDRSRDRS